MTFPRRQRPVPDRVADVFLSGRLRSMPADALSGMDWRPPAFNIDMMLVGRTIFLVRCDPDATAMHPAEA